MLPQTLRVILSIGTAISKLKTPNQEMISSMRKNSCSCKDILNQRVSNCECVCVSVLTVGGASNCSWGSAESTVVVSTEESDIYRFENGEWISLKLSPITMPRSHFFYWCQQCLLRSFLSLYCASSGYPLGWWTVLYILCSNPPTFYQQISLHRANTAGVQRFLIMAS